MKNKDKFLEDFIHLARISLSGRGQDVQAFLLRIAKRKDTDPKITEELLALLRNNPSRSSPLRRNQEMAVPVDTDSRFQLLRIEEVPVLVHEPVYSGEVQQVLDRLVQERQNLPALVEAGLDATKTVLFTGPPGVGKTLAARWLARELKRPLLILDLSAVMSSYLGRTGANLRHVLEYAKSYDCVLLLDELDAIAKRRDDSGEIGELKRLVTVLLQQLDDWPASNLLIAATNHADLLDPAVWRRFEQPVEFAIPSQEAAKLFISGLLEAVDPKFAKWSSALSLALSGKSYSDIERDINIARRAAALNGKDLGEHLGALMTVEGKTKQERIDLAVELVSKKFTSQRKAHEITGIARETIRDRVNNS